MDGDSPMATLPAELCDSGEGDEGDGEPHEAARSGRGRGGGGGPSKQSVFREQRGVSELIPRSIAGGSSSTAGRGLPLGPAGAAVQWVPWSPTYMGMGSRPGLHTVQHQGVDTVASSPPSSSSSSSSLHAEAEPVASVSSLDHRGGKIPPPAPKRVDVVPVWQG